MSLRDCDWRWLTERLIVVYFGLGITSSLAGFAFQRLFDRSTLFSHGKAGRGLTSREAAFWTRLLLSKRLFWHFYALGTAAAAGCLLLCPLRHGGHAPIVLLLIQCGRRLGESFSVMPGGVDSHMHLLHYLVGLSYYPVLLVSYCVVSHGGWRVEWMVGFIFASLVQHHCHRILGRERAKLQAQSREPGLHRPIDHWLFRIVHAPHYTAEVAIYLCIAGCCQFDALSVLNLVWIVSLLGVSAHNSAEWMREAWQKRGHVISPQWLIIPFIL